jgi:aminopeptidase N
VDEPKAYQLAKEFHEHPAKGELNAAIVAVFIKEGDESNFEFIIDGFSKMPELSLEKVEAFPQFAALTLKMENTDQFKRAIDAIVKYRDALPATEKREISKLINDNFLKPIGDRKESAGLKEQAEYVRSKLN